MRRHLALTLLLLAPFAMAQDDPAARAIPPPPPSMDDAGPEPATPAPPAEASEGEGDTVTLDEAVPDASEKVVPSEPVTRDGSEEAPLPEKVRPPDEIAPAVTIRTEGDLTIEEYRRDGQIYMVRVVPQKGIPYTYLDTDGDGRLEGDPRDGPIQPVYYTVYEWE